MLPRFSIVTYYLDSKIQKCTAVCVHFKENISNSRKIRFDQSDPLIGAFIALGKLKLEVLIIM